MEKTISRFDFEPLMIRLVGRGISLFVDPVNGVIFVDEGEGEDRINGVAMSPKNRPRFEAARTDKGFQLILHYARFHFEMGCAPLESPAARWVEEANRHLARFAPPLAAPDLPETFRSNSAAETIPEPGTSVRANGAAADCRTNTKEPQGIS